MIYRRGVEWECESSAIFHLGDNVEMNVEYTLECIRAIVLNYVELRCPSGLKHLSLIHISEPTRPLYISYAVFCLKKKKAKKKKKNKKKIYLYFFF